MASDPMYVLCACSDNDSLAHIPAVLEAIG